MFQKAAIYPLLAILFWAGNVVVSKMASHVISPVAMTFYRLILALAIMSVFVLLPTWQNRKKIALYWKQLALGGFLSVSLFQFLSYQAAATTTATNMAIITALIPMLTMILSSFMLKERVGFGMVVGGAISFYGIVYLLNQGNVNQISHMQAHSGDVLILIAAIGYAFYGVLLKKWQIPLPAWQSNFIQSTFALLYVLPFFIFLPATSMGLNAETIPLIIYASIFSSVLLSYLWIEGIRHLGPNKNSFFMNLLPLFTACIAVLILGEQLQRFHLVGGGITLAGIMLAQLTFKTRSQAKSKPI